MDRSEWKQYILETYHAVSDRPWPRYPNHEVFRHPGNRKWFALMMEVPGAKLGLPERGMLDILNLKCDPVLIASLRGAPGIFPVHKFSTSVRPSLNPFNCSHAQSQSHLPFLTIEEFRLSGYKDNEKLASSAAWSAAHLRAQTQESASGAFRLTRTG